MRRYVVRILLVVGALLVAAAVGGYVAIKMVRSPARGERRLKPQFQTITGVKYVSGPLGKVQEVQIRDSARIQALKDALAEVKVLRYESYAWSPERLLLTTQAGTMTIFIPASEIHQFVIATRECDEVGNGWACEGKSLEALLVSWPELSRKQTPSQEEEARLRETFRVFTSVVVEPGLGSAEYPITDARRIAVLRDSLVGSKAKDYQKVEGTVAKGSLRLGCPGPYDKWLRVEVDPSGKMHVVSLLVEFESPALEEAISSILR